MNSSSTAPDAFADVFGSHRGPSVYGSIRWEDSELLWDDNACIQGKTFAKALLERFYADDGDDQLVTLLNDNPISPAREYVPIPLDDYPVVDWLLESIIARMDMGWMKENCISLWDACFPSGDNTDKRDELVSEALDKIRGSASLNLQRYVSRGAVQATMLHRPQLATITIDAHISDVFGPYLNRYGRAAMAGIVGKISAPIYQMDANGWRAFARKWGEWYDGDIELAKIKARTFIRENARFVTS